MSTKLIKLMNSMDDHRSMKIERIVAKMRRTGFTDDEIAERIKTMVNGDN